MLEAAGVLAIERSGKVKIGVGGNNLHFGTDTVVVIVGEAHDDEGEGRRKVCGEEAMQMKRCVSVIKQREYN